MIIVKALRARRDRITCRRVVELVTDYLEGTLGEADRHRLDRHLAGCPGCREYVEQMRTTVNQLGAARTDPPPDEIRQDLMEMYRRFRSG